MVYIGPIQDHLLNKLEARGAVANKTRADSLSKAIHAVNVCIAECEYCDKDAELDVLRNVVFYLNRLLDLNS